MQTLLNVTLNLLHYNSKNEFKTNQVKMKNKKHDELSLAIMSKVETVSTQASLAEELGYSVGKVNYILKALIAKGLIKVENFSNSKNKRQYRYLLTRDGIKEKINLTEKFIERKKEEYKELMLQLQLDKERYGEPK